MQAACFAAVAWLVRGGLDPAYLSMLLAMAAVLGYMRALSGTVWLGVGVHAAFQTASQMLIGGWRGPLALTGIR